MQEGRTARTNDQLAPSNGRRPRWPLSRGSRDEQRGIQQQQQQQPAQLWIKRRASSLPRWPRARGPPTAGGLDPSRRRFQLDVTPKRDALGSALALELLGTSPFATVPALSSPPADNPPNPPNPPNPHRVLRRPGPFLEPELQLLLLRQLIKAPQACVVFRSTSPPTPSPPELPSTPTSDLSMCARRSTPFSTLLNPFFLFVVQTVSSPALSPPTTKTRFPRRHSLPRSRLWLKLPPPPPATQPLSRAEQRPPKSANGDGDVCLLPRTPSRTLSRRSAAAPFSRPTLRS